MTSILQAEINEQPLAVRRFLTAESATADRLVRDLRPHNIQYVLIAARGTSDNAARYAQYVLGAYNHLQVALATPSLYTLYGTPPDLRGALVVGISQSGRSPDIVSVLAAGRAQGRPTLAITNVPDSPLAQAADWVLPLGCGVERAVAATKTYTTSLAALALLSTAFSGDAPRRAELARVPDWMSQTLSGVESVLPRVERYRYVGRSAVIGRGFNYATAFEVALKVKELTRVVTESYSSADFLHGPISVLEQGFPLIVVAPGGQTLGDLATFAVEAKRRGAELIVISDDEALLQQAQLPLALPAGVPEWLSPLVAVLPGQLFAMHLAAAKGLNVDQPVGLTKVTETR
ncbi:MAG TPA: SIS domain-containing protein [Anaerolineae bacterium]|nr:SIS domain-containing protein [Anaerolineae bacterium]